MNLRHIPIIILSGISLSLVGQTKTKEDISVDILKSKSVDNVSVFGVRQLKVTSDDLRKVMVKTKISSTASNKTKLSAFSLLDTKNKIRYRLADYKGYSGIIGNPELIPFRKSPIYNDKGTEINSIGLPAYDPSEKDYFNDFDKDGYQNFELQINFGTSQQPRRSIVYFGETDYEKFTAELFFAVLSKYQNSSYELYYKDEKIGNISFL